MAQSASDANGSRQLPFDVLIVGAGISGIGAAYHLLTQCAGKSFAVLEAKDTFGGTWSTFRYPGIRSDSDLYTFGYRFKPWTGTPIASAPAILEYMSEVIEENGIDQHIRYGHKIVSAAWSSEDNLWTVTVQRNGADGTEELHARFLWMCQGYYRHDQGYLPEWPGMNEFKGELIHAQTWPDDLDLTGKSVIVIGSGATAATLVPNLANEAAGVTMLQRSPTYFLSVPNRVELADELRELGIQEAWIHEIARRKMNRDFLKVFEDAMADPEGAKKQWLAALEPYLPKDIIEQHFTPHYPPFTQRPAVVPDGDLFKAIGEGRASVVTDEIERFTPEGIALKSGATLTADIIVAATGFELSPLGDVKFTVDGEDRAFSDTVTYRGMMFTGLPNLVWIFGYFRASWTQRVDLVGDFVCRLLRHMDAKGSERVEVALRPQDEGMALLPFIAPENFNPGYLSRGMHLLPKRGEKPEWQHNQNYWKEREEFPLIDLDDQAFVYS